MGCAVVKPEISDPSGGRAKLAIPPSTTNSQAGTLKNPSLSADPSSPDPVKSTVATTTTPIPSSNTPTIPDRTPTSAPPSQSQPPTASATPVHVGNNSTARTKPLLTRDNTETDSFWEVEGVGIVKVKRLSVTGTQMALEASIVAPASNHIEINPGAPVSPPSEVPSTNLATTATVVTDIDIPAPPVRPPSRRVSLVRPASSGIQKPSFEPSGPEHPHATFKLTDEVVKVLQNVLEDRLQAAINQTETPDKEAIGSELSLLKGDGDVDEKFIEAAKKCKLIGQLPLQILSKMSLRCPLVHFEPNAALIHEGDLPEVAYLLQSGRLHVFVGANKFKLDYGPGDLVGERTILNNLPNYTQDITANEGSVSAYKMPRDLVIKAMHMQGDFHENRTQRMREMNEFLMQEVLA